MSLTRATGIIRTKETENKTEITVLYSLISSNPFCYAPSIRGKSLSLAHIQKDGTAFGYKYQEARITGGHLRKLLVTTTSKRVIAIYESLTLKWGRVKEYNFGNRPFSQRASLSLGDKINRNYKTNNSHAKGKNKSAIIKGMKSDIKLHKNNLYIKHHTQ